MPLENANDDIGFESRLGLNQAGPFAPAKSPRLGFELDPDPLKRIVLLTCPGKFWLFMANIGQIVFSSDGMQNIRVQCCGK